MSTDASSLIAVVIPCYKVRSFILDVLAKIDVQVTHIFVVDDACPEQTGAWVRQHSSDPRVQVLTHSLNLGVGGAVLTGYRAAMAAGVDVIVKIDGDGQMNPRLYRHFVTPILQGRADYTKGNRFYDLTYISRMPKLRLLGNAVLSFMTKFSSGYWQLFDPTNGYTAISARVAAHLPMDKISSRYFFETDMLFRLNTLRAVVLDIPMDAQYGEEVSNLRISSILPEFLWKHTLNVMKRLFYNYFLRDLTLASLELVFGFGMLTFGVMFGLYHWLEALHTHVLTPLGTIMLATLPSIVGLQLLLAFVGFDIANQPKIVIHDVLPDAPLHGVNN